MAKKRKPGRFSATKAVKAAAREKIGTPPATRRESAKPKSDEKHKPSLSDLLSERD
jgi:hypothetical protein